MKLPTAKQLRAMLRALRFSHLEKIIAFYVVGSVAKGNKSPSDLDIAVEMRPVRGYANGLKFTEQWHLRKSMPYRRCSDPAIWMPRWDWQGNELPIDFQFFFEGEQELE